MMPLHRNVLLLVLTAAAGCADAVTFLHTGAFTANMTGNTVILALAASGADTARGIAAALALAGFVLGAVGVAALYAPYRRLGGRRPLSLCLWLEALVLALASMWLFLDREAHVHGLIPLVATAMGMQSGIARQLGTGGLSTTAVSTTITTAANRLTLFAYQGPAMASSGGSWLHGTAWLVYLAAAVLGALHAMDRLNLLLPVLLVATALALVLVRRTDAAEG